MQNLKKSAESGAKKICGIGMCTCPFKCDHANHTAPVLETDSFYWSQEVDIECPLYRYNVKPDTRKWYERDYEESYPSNDEIFAVCALCGHADVTDTGDGYEEIHFQDPAFCINCPVKETIDYMREEEAEAGCS